MIIGLESACSAKESLCNATAASIADLIEGAQQPVFDDILGDIAPSGELVGSDPVKTTAPDLPLTTGPEGASTADLDLSALPESSAYGKILPPSGNALPASLSAQTDTGPVPTTSNGERPAASRIEVGDAAVPLELTPPRPTAKAAGETSAETQKQTENTSRSGVQVSDHRKSSLDTTNDPIRVVQPKPVEHAIQPADTAPKSGEAFVRSIAPEPRSDNSLTLQTLPPSPLATTSDAGQVRTGSPPPASSAIDNAMRQSPPVEQLIESLSQARESGRQARGEMLIRHEDFGLVTLRLTTSDSGLGTALASRDPGFAFAAQQALMDRPSPQPDAGPGNARSTDNAMSQQGQQRGETPSGSHQRRDGDSPQADGNAIPGNNTRRSDVPSAGSPQGHSLFA